MTDLATRRIQAVLYRYLINIKRNFTVFAGAVYIPVIDLVVWGITGKWLSESLIAGANFYKIILTALIFWHIINRLIAGIISNLLEEVWSSNLGNLFATPLRLSEWVISVLIVGLLNAALTMLIGYLAAFVLYSFNFFELGFYFLPFLLPLLIFGWALGFFVASFVIYYGAGVQSLGWCFCLLLAPFSAVYFPLEALPHWALYISKVLPTSYIFEGLRIILSDAFLPLDYIIYAFLLSIFYLILSILFFNRMFERKRIVGFNSWA